ncbi:hypothetical protein BURMUCGD2M_6597 [Burkholderia multivorans CGD2M]|nr:hypothetical protein BURMUCGD2M_6597 [Burkholderia multivorans CGD2M]
MNIAEPLSVRCGSLRLRRCRSLSSTEGLFGCVRRAGHGQSGAVGTELFGRFGGTLSVDVIGRPTTAS